ncbi:MAG: hypothetical protein RIE06_33760 [Roseibium album]|uniref:hypothetical protein n=1 Tax=Roseibium album TaxID=311410 RepID=UPI0032EB7FE8
MELGVKKIRLDQLSRKDDPDWRDSLTPKKREAKWRKINRSYQAGKRSLRASEQRLQVSVSEHVNEMPSDLRIKVKFAQCLAHVASKTVEQEDVEFLNLPCGYPEKVKPEAVEPNAVKRDRTVDIIYVKYVLVLVLQGMLKVDDRSDCADPGGTSWNLFRSLKKPVAVCIALLRGVFGNRLEGVVVDDSGRKVRKLDSDDEEDRSVDYESKLELMKRVRTQSSDFDPTQLSPGKFEDVFKEDGDVLGESERIWTEFMRSSVAGREQRKRIDALLLSPKQVRPPIARTRNYDDMRT